MKSSFFQTSVSLGELIKFNTTPTGISGETTFGKFRAAIYSETICRISITQQDDFDDFSYSVITPLPAKAEFEVNDAQFEVILSTSAFRLHVQKNPVRFMFTDLTGQVINQDDTGLGTAWIGEQVSTYKKLQEGERFIGLGEKTGPLDRKGAGYQNWTTDAYAYHGSQDPLYCSTPFYMGLHSGKIYGIFLDNTHKSFFNFGASNNRFSSFSADAGEMNYYFMTGESIPEIIKGYTCLTGRMEMPPLWSIGYQQCRYSYYPDKEVTSLARTFREKDIPADVIVLDVHYMDKYKIFTWDKKHFPDPVALVKELKSLGFHVVVICDPGIKIEEGYAPYDDGKKQNAFIKYPDGVEYAGQVWPGWCNFPDFSRPSTREWWAVQLKDYVNTGIEGFWNDMNEIATWGNALPDNLIFDFEGNGATSRRGRNIYGFQMARSTYEGAKSLLKGKRPFNLTRSGFSGIQRYSAVWTGDNVAYDEHMILGVRMISSLGLAGVAFAGYDVGGFVGDANTKLFARWVSLGALSPFFRGHSMINSRDAEPWSFGEEVEQIARNFIKLRYQLLPYIYSLYHDAAERGMPVQRSLAIYYPFLHQVYDHAFQNQYLFGPFILVAPVESTKELVKIFLPPGEWSYLYTGKQYAGNQEIILECPIHRLPVFIKGGALLPMQRSRPHTGVADEELILNVYRGKEDTTFTFYEDDGETYEYQTGKSALREISYFPADRKIIIEKAAGTYVSQKTKLRIIFHHWDASSVIVGGAAHELIRENHSFFTPMEKYDPIHEPESMGSEEVQTLSTSWSAEQIEIRW